MGLRPNTAYTPRLQEGMTRLATWLPFQHAANELEFFTGVPVAEATVRRITEAAGAASVAVDEAAVDRLEREVPPTLPGPALQLLSVDGAFIQLVNCEWKEVKTLALGEVQPPVMEQGKLVVHTRNLSYFSRCSSVDTFERQALVETHRRGVSEAGVVCGVTDGSGWCQSFIDYHRPDAVRILDQPHGLEYVAAVGKAIYGEGTQAFTTWFATQHRRLNTLPAAVVLDEIRRLAATSSVEVVQAGLAYLAARESMLQYAVFIASGYPIGDGCVESANKLGVEARLKGAGMRWALAHVDPMLALRNLACNDRWKEGWAQIEAEQQQSTRRKRQAQRQRHEVACRPPAASPSVSPQCPPSMAGLAGAAGDVVAQPTVPKAPYRPAADHPWRRPFTRRVGT